MSRFPICTDCLYGVVQQRREEIGTQDPSHTIYCTLMEKGVPTDLVFCSKQQSPLNRMHPMDLTLPEPRLLLEKKSAQKVAAEVITIMLDTVKQNRR